MVDGASICVGLGGSDAKSRPFTWFPPRNIEKGSVESDSTHCNIVRFICLRPPRCVSTGPVVVSLAEMAN
jgi:hypothetical protein